MKDHRENSQDSFGGKKTSVAKLFESVDEIPTEDREYVKIHPSDIMS